MSELKRVPIAVEAASQKALTGMLSFKGTFVRYCKAGKRLYLQTTKFLYQVHQTGKGFRLQIMRTYAS